MTYWQSVLLAVGFWLVLAVLASFLARNRLTGCRCGRTKMPWFDHVHVKQPLRFVCIVLAFGDAGLEAIWGDMIDAIFMGLLALFFVKGFIEHGKGKRRWPKRVLGYVTFNDHGRLVVKA